MSGTPKDLCTLLWKLFLWNNARYIVWVHECMLSRFNSIQLFATLWTIGHQAPLSMGILQARILECVAVFYYRGSSWPKDWTCISCDSRIGRQVLYYCATWEATIKLYFIYLSEGLSSLLSHFLSTHCMPLRKEWAILVSARPMHV